MQENPKTGRTVGIIALIILGICLVACVGLVVVFFFGVSLVPSSTAVVLPTETHTPTTTLTPSPTTTRPQETATPPPTATRRPTQTATATSTAPAPTATHTPRPAATLVATATPSPAPSPTTIVCTSIDQMEGLTLASGQAFSCTVTQKELVRQAEDQPELPCSSIDVQLQEGEAAVSCRIGLLTLRAVGVVEVNECQISIHIVRGTAGFVQVAQQMIDANIQRIPVGHVCVEAVEIKEGALQVRGYGR